MPDSPRPPKCTYAGCDAEATQVLAYPTISDAMWVAPYRDEHGAGLRSEYRTLFACGPALSPEASKISGVRR